MCLTFHYLLIFGFFLSFSIGNIHHVCDICSCDNNSKPIDVHCDSKRLSTLKNLDFNSSIQTLSLVNNFLSLTSTDDLAKINAITSLKSLILTNNPLFAIPELSLPDLVHLKLDNTYLKNELIFKSYLNSTKLQSINFDRNKLKHVPNGLVKLDQIKSLSFRHNRISIIDESSPFPHWLQTNRTNMEIYLENNPFDCCRSRWFVHYLNDPKNLVKDAVNLTCALPKRYIGRRLVDLHTDLMDCSNELFYPLNKLILFLLCLSGVMIFIVLVVVTTLYRRLNIPIRRRQRRRGYQSLQIDDLFA